MSPSVAATTAEHPSSCVPSRSHLFLRRIPSELIYYFRIFHFFHTVRFLLHAVRHEIRLTIRPTVCLSVRPSKLSPRHQQHRHSVHKGLLFAAADGSHWMDGGGIRYITTTMVQLLFENNLSAQAIVHPSIHPSRGELATQTHNMTKVHPHCVLWLLLLLLGL